MHLGGLAMGLTKCKFGELIELYFVRNDDLRCSADEAIGVNIIAPSQE